MNGEPSGTPRWPERVRAIVLRVLAVSAGLGLWFWTQSLIGRGDSRTAACGTVCTSSPQASTAGLPPCPRGATRC